MRNNPVIVTGATGAIGFEIALQLVKDGESVILAVRNTSRGEIQAQRMRDIVPDADITVMSLDLEDRSSIMQFVDRIAHSELRPKALVNNAGIMNRFYRENSEGIESTIAVNTVGTALLTLRLIPFMTPGARIVFTTSLTRKFNHVSPEILQEDASKFSQLGTYGRSKIGITCFAQHLAQQYPGMHINCADPGVVDTNMITMKRWYDPLANLFFRPFIRTPRQGAEAALRAVAVEDSGRIFTRRGSAPIKVRGKEKDINLFIDKLYSCL